MWKQFLKDYFLFTRKERRGVIVLLIFILTITIVHFFFPLIVQEDIIDHSEFSREIAQLKIDSSQRKYAKYTDPAFENDHSPEFGRSKKALLFYFDPNTATVNDWVKLGVKEKTATTIQKYIAKGGKFYKPEDIRKIWGLSKQDADRLVPYVQIKKEQPSYVVYEKKVEPEKPVNNIRSKELRNMEINAADTSSFKKFPGIGSKLSQRIINFRDKLGGFYSVEQVGETYLLPDSTFKKIKPYLILDEVALKKININSAPLDELKNHPYIRFHVGNAIVQYRNQHGNFTSVEEIRKIMIITDSIYYKVVPYLALD